MMASAAHPRAVLIVEDDPESASGLAEMLELMGYTSEIAENGKVALDCLRKAPATYCLILLDLMMPVMDGWDFLSEQRNDKALMTIPVVIVTAVLDAKAKAANTNAVAVLAKPIDTGALGAMVQRHC